MTTKQHRERLRGRIVLHVRGFGFAELAARVDGMEEFADRVSRLEGRLDHDDETS